jgi:hypothetical protein
VPALPLRPQCLCPFFGFVDVDSLSSLSLHAGLEPNSKFFGVFVDAYGNGASVGDAGGGSGGALALFARICLAKFNHLFFFFGSVACRCVAQVRPKLIFRATSLFAPDAYTASVSFSATKSTGNGK